MTDLALRLENISRFYGKVKAVDDLSLEIPAGTFVTLLGPSGCGKSTTLALIAGLDRLDQGKILLGDQDITDTPPNERKMAMVFQNYALYPHMTAYDNIAFGLKLQHRPKAEIDQRVKTIAASLDISHLLKRKPGQMSGGQQQRVALGRALVKEPVVFLLDEPFSNLDAGLRSRMRTEVKHLHLKLGTTSVFVTHDQEEAMSLSDFIAVMRDGKIVQFGPTKEIYRKPRDLYVATFVGKPKMSLVDGELSTTDGKVSFVSPDLKVELGTPGAIGLRDGTFSRVAMGVRAEDVKVWANGGAPDPAHSFNAAVQLLEPIGSDTFVELATGDAMVVARVAPDAGLQLGQNVTVELLPDRIHLFEREQGERIVA
jgi:multiple sugar transport system ATP-binding protein